jgi:hypothetical protein
MSKSIGAFAALNAHFGACRISDDAKMTHTETKRAQTNQFIGDMGAAQYIDMLTEDGHIQQYNVGDMHATMLEINNGVNNCMQQLQVLHILAGELPKSQGDQVDLYVRKLISKGFGLSRSFNDFMLRMTFAVASRADDEMRACMEMAEHIKHNIDSAMYELVYVEQSIRDMITKNKRLLTYRISKL